MLESYLQRFKQEAVSFFCKAKDTSGKKIILNDLINELGMRKVNKNKLKDSVL